MTDTIRNPLTSKPLEEIIAERYSRRDVLGTAGKLGLVALLGAALRPRPSFAQAATASTALDTGALTFNEIEKTPMREPMHRLAPGYDLRLLIRWGDRLQPDAPAFDPLQQSADAQLRQFGFNNDFIAYMPFPPESNSSTNGLLCVNHEYTLAHLMFPGLQEDTAKDHVTQDQVDVEMAATGHSVVEIRRNGDQWEPVVGSPYNRRISAKETDMHIGGPVRGHPRVRTSADPQGKVVRGTFGNCAGGVTPWGTVLVSEENFDGYFAGEAQNEREAANHERYGVGQETWYGWHRFYDRFDVSKEMHEPNRYGWVVEYDPYNPQKMPIKRTALGRFKHETATTVLAPDGRVVVYSGDDEKYEYLYRFVSLRKYDPVNRDKNLNILDMGFLHVAKFHSNGLMEWLPLKFGEGGLTPANGFENWGDVYIETRRSADVLGATPMDRPEGIAVEHKTNRVYVSLTNNASRTPEEVNIANPRAHNKHGHIIELTPPAGDHAAQTFHWKMFLRGGNPAVQEDNARYGGPVSANGWLSCPDNLATDQSGNLWICTDGSPKTVELNDGLYAAATSGDQAAIPRLFFTGPAGCEVTGPAFTPDGETLFLSVQHPGDTDGDNFDKPSTRWPDFDEKMPPRPSVVAITKIGGGRIGS